MNMVLFLLLQVLACHAASVVALDVGARATRDFAFDLRLESEYRIPQRSWAQARAKANRIVAKMTVEEKANVTQGQGWASRCAGVTGSAERVGVPSFCYQDGPAGVRPDDLVTSFPAGVTVASTWDRDLMYARGVAMGKEFFGKGINIALSPVTGGPLGRNAAAGRNWEGSSPDPYLTGIFSYMTTKGLQDTGVIACAKHWLAYEQETYRNPGSGYYTGFPVQFNNTVSMSSDVDERTLHELYMWGFVESIRAGVGSVMCSYNRVNQTYACENKDLITKYLREELKFPGLVMSDWLATHNTELSSQSGLDVEMPSIPYNGENQIINDLPSQYLGQTLVAAIKNGTIPESRLDRMAVTTLSTMYRFGHDSKHYPKVNFNISGPSGNDNVNVQANHREVALAIASDGVVLLKNTGILPLKKTQSLAILGGDAGPPAGHDPYFGGISPVPTYHGTNSQGLGSGWVRPPYIIDPLSALQHRSRANGGLLLTRPAYTGTSIEWRDIGIPRIRFDLGNFNPSTTQTIMTEQIMDSEVCLVFTSAIASEGYDRANMSLDDAGDELITYVANGCKNTVVIMHVPGQVNMAAWNNHPNVTAILNAHLPGQESGNAIVQVLYGDVNPSGKLPYTIAAQESDYVPIYKPLEDNITVTFAEKLEIDYRGFDAKNITPLYEFGFGLSYTKWKYSGLTVRKASGSSPTVYDASENIGGKSSLFEYVLSATVNIDNVGKVKGHEIAQLYVSFPEEAGEPPKLLRGFDKVKNVWPGCSASAKFKLTRKDLSIWDSVLSGWRIVPGTYHIMVGKSSRKIELVAKVKYEHGTWTIL